MPNPIAIILLAAGGSSRLGEPKQLLEADGQPLVRRVTGQLISLDAGPVGVVVGAHMNAVIAALHDTGANLIRNHVWQRGIGGSVSAGAAWAAASAVVNPQIAGLMIVLCDQPDVPLDHLRALLKAARLHPTDCVATEYADSTGVPAIVPERLFKRLGALPTDAGAKQILNDPHETVIRIRCEAAAVDLDTPDDVRKWREAR